MIDGYRIRAYRPEDLKRLHEIRKAAFEPVFRSFRALVGEGIAKVAFVNLEKEQADHLNDLCRDDSKHRVLIVEDRVNIVGFCALQFDHDIKLGEVGLNAVDPAHQNKGIGSWMYEAALEEMRVAGMRAVTVGTGADDSHAPARRAYQKVGFSAAVPGVHYYRSL